MASSDELIRLYGYLLDLSRLIMERMKTPGEYEDLEMLNGQFLPLMIIASQEGMTQVELAHRLRRTKGATTFIVNKLEDWGLVERNRCSTRCMLYLTEKGRRICMQKRAQDLATADRVMESVPIDQDQLENANLVLDALISFCLADADENQRSPENL